MGRIVGIDYGTKRIGFAVSDETAMLATPLRVVEASGIEAAAAAAAGVCREMGAERAVVGLPLNMNGTAGPAAAQVVRFVEELRRRSGLPVETWDERLTTVLAERALIEGGASRARRKQVVDKLAAQVVLQGYLDAAAGGGAVDAEIPNDGCV